MSKKSSRSVPPPPVAVVQTREDAKRRAAIKARLAEPKRKAAPSRLKGVEIVYDAKRKFTVQLAVSYINLPKMDYERKVDQAWVATLADVMPTDLYLAEDVMISVAVCGWDGKERRLNGQHTCWARLAQPKGWQPTVRVVKYVVKTEDEYRLLYIQKDRNRARTAGQRAGAMLIGTPEFKQYSPRAVKKTEQGFKFWFYPTEHPTTEDVSTRMRGKYKNTSQAVGDLVEEIIGLQSGHLDRGPVFAAIYETVEKAAAPAIAFWRKIIHALNFQSHTDPAKVLSEYLRRTVLKSDSNKNKQRVTRNHMYNVCVECFKAHQADRQLTKTPAGTREHRSTVK